MIPKLLPCSMCRVDIAQGEPRRAIGNRFIATGVVRETNMVDADGIGAIRCSAKLPCA